MADPVVTRIQSNPKYHELKRKRNFLGVLLLVLVLIVFYGYIALIAFNKPFLSITIGTGVTTIGVPIAIGVILFTIIVTGIYVWRANTEFDELTSQIMKEAVR